MLPLPNIQETVYLLRFLLCIANVFCKSSSQKETEKLKNTFISIEYSIFGYYNTIIYNILHNIKNKPTIKISHKQQWHLR